MDELLSTGEIEQGEYDEWVQTNIPKSGNIVTNGTEKAHEYLRNFYERKRNKPKPTVSLVSTMMVNKASFAQTLSRISDKLQGKKIGIWDTESDAVGGGWDLVDTREWLILDFQNHKTLHITRRDAGYSDEKAARSIHKYLKTFDFLIAFEPGNCDRNRYFSTSIHL